jgi:stage II sporulation protein D
VNCPDDVDEKDYSSSSSVSLSDFKNKVLSFNSKADFSGSPQNFIKNISRSNAGGIITAELCGKKVTGTELRELFSLRSTNISVKYENNKFNFSVKGYGHGVGMSQTEA